MSDAEKNRYLEIVRANTPAELIAQRAVEMADALIAELKKGAPAMSAVPKIDCVDLLRPVLDLGLGVFPCVTNRRNPLTEHGFKDASADPKRIAAWAHEHPGCNWGTALTSDYVVVDVDTKKGHDGFGSLRALQAKHSALPETRKQSTPSAGAHLLFTRDPALELKNSASEVADGIDIKTLGGYICVAPSVIDEKPYRWADPAAAVAAAPDWLIEEIRLADKRKPDNTGAGRNVAMTSYAGQLRRARTEYLEAWTMVLKRNQTYDPPMEEAEVKGILDSVWRNYEAPNEEFAGAHPDIIEELRDLPPDLIVLPNDYVPTPIAARRIFGLMGANLELFARHGRAVEIEESALAMLSAQALRSRLDGRGRRVKTVVKSKDDLVMVYKRCSASNAEVLLAAREVRTLPPIELVTDAPFLVENGTAAQVLGRGYHSVCGGVMVLKGKEPEAVSLERAVPALLALVEDFRFTEPADMSRAIAGYIGPCLRMGGFVYGHALINAVEADQSQTGKDYLLNSQRACYGGSVYVISRREGGVGSADESTAQGFASGRPFLYYENVRGRMASEYLEGAITSFDPIPVRLPHRGEFTVNARHVTFQLSSNGVEAIQDLANRVLITRLLKQPRGYKFKRYAEGSLLQHIQARQPFYAGCIFAVVRFWHAAGKPTLATHHSFGDWIGSLDWIVQEVFKLPPLLDGHDGAVDRIANPALSWLRAVALAVIAEGKAGQLLLTHTLLEIAQSIDAAVPRARADMPDDAQHRLIGTHMAKCFRTAETIQLDAISVRRYTAEEYSQNRQRYEPVRRYKFWPGDAGHEPPHVGTAEGDM